jgi:glutathione S-transferase
LETWLRMAGVPYDALSLNKPPQSRTGKVPYILLDNGATLADTNIIIRTLARERGIDLDYLRTPEELASEHVTMRLVEESLYYAMVWERWMLPAFWPISRDGYFGTLPGPLRTLFANLIRRKIKTTLRGQGLLCHEPDEIIARGIADVRGLSALLGQKAFFGGERPGVADASAYGVLANLLGFPGRTALKIAVQACPNLVTFCRRIEYLYWLNLPASGSAVAIRPAIKNVA